MSVVPSDEDFLLELGALSSTLYDCIDQADKLGPTYSEYDRLRDKRLCQARTLLATFGVARNKQGWTTLLNAYGYQHPTLSEVQQAAYRRKEERRERTYTLELDESFPELLYTSSREEQYESTLPDGTPVKVLRTYYSIR